MTEILSLDAPAAARALIGWTLLVDGVGGIIVETEAYDRTDPASHSFRGPTPGNATMFGPAGRAYVYRSYGIHWCLNFVCGPDGSGQAVLIRAVAPLVGLGADHNVGRGPGKVTTALKLDRRHDRKDLAKGELYVSAHDQPPALASGSRVGVAYAKEWADKPFRFWWRDHPAVSRVK